MYNLIVGAGEGAGSLPSDRMLEGRSPEVENWVRPAGPQGPALNIDRLLALPALTMPETGDSSSRQVAVIGRVVDLRQAGREWRFRLLRDPTVPEIPSNRIEGSARALGIGDSDFTRTRWTIKDVDLYQVLLAEKLLSVATPTVFKLPADPPDANLVSVMMPFSSEFTRVYRAIRAAAAEGEWLCRRVDDIWENSAIIEDVVALIARSSAVVCDFTDRNPNVFYETGIAHALGRPVIPITQSDDDVPFDLKQHRYLRYDTSESGLNRLQLRLYDRLETLMTSREGSQT